MSLDIGKVTIALLGLLAYKNRDKIGGMLSGGSDPNAPAGSGGGGLGDLIDRFRQTGAGDKAESWVGPGTNQPIERSHVEQAIDPETLDRLAEQTGLSRDELLERLTKDIPDTVDRMTPEGRLPEEASSPPVGDNPLKSSKW